MGRLPPLCALFLLAVLYILRWVMLGSIVSNIIETTIEDNLAAPYQVQTGRIGGSLFGGIELNNTSIVASSSDALVQKIEIETLQISYRLVDVLSLPPVSDALGVSFSKNNMHTAWLFTEELSIADAAENLHSTLPPGLTVRTKGSLIMADGTSEVAADFAFEAGGSYEEEGRLAALGLSNAAITQNGRTLRFPVDLDPISFYLTSEENIVHLHTGSREESAGMHFEALIKAEAHRSGQRLSSFMLELEAMGVSLHGRVETGTAELDLTAAKDSEAGLFLQQILDAADLQIGALELNVSAGRAEESEDLSLISALVANPSEFYKRAAIDARVSAAGWAFSPISISSLSAALEWKEETLLVLSMRGDIVVPALELNGIPGSQELRISASGVSWRPFLNSFKAEHLRAEGGSGALDVDGSLKLQGSPVSFTRLKGDLAGRLALENPERMLSILSRLLEIKNLPLAFSDQSDADLQFSVKGRPSGFEGHAAFRSSEVRIAGFEIEKADIELKITEEEVVVDSLRFENGNGIIIADGRIRIPGFNLEHYEFTVSGRQLGVWNPLISAVSVSGSGAHSSITLSRAEIEFQSSPDPRLSLSSPLLVSWEKNGVELGQFTLLSELGRIRGKGVIGLDSVSAEIEASGIPVAALWRILDAENELSVSGYVSLRVLLNGPLHEPDFSVAIEGNQLLLEEREALLDISAEQKSGIVHIQKLDVDLPTVARMTGQGNIPLTIGTNGIRLTELAAAKLILDVELFEPFRFFDSLQQMPFAQSDIDLSVSLNDKGGTIKLAAQHLSAEVDPIIIGVRPAESLTLQVDAGPLFEAPVEIDAGLYSDTEDLATMSFTILSRNQETAENNAVLLPIGLTAEIALDVPLIHVSHLIPGISLHGGRLRGTPAFRFDSGGLSVDGSLSVIDAFLKISPQVPTLSAVNGRVALKGRSLVIEDLSAQMGPGLLDGSARIGFSAEGPPELDARMSGTDLVLLRSPGLRAAGNADISVGTEGGTTFISGTLELGDVLYSRPVELFSLGKPAVSPEDYFQLFRFDFTGADSISLDIKATADGTINIDNNLYNGSLSADVYLGGTASLPLIEGRVFADEGRMTLPTALLEIQQLEMVFPEDATLAPQIYAKAGANVQGYDMSVIVDGQIPSVEISVASSPPLGTDEALLLLTTGLSSADLSFQNDTNGTLTAAGAVLGTTFINRISDSLSEEEIPFFERLDFTVEQDESGSPLGALQIEYQLSKEERWFLLFERQAEEDYTIRLAWRLWAE